MSSTKEAMLSVYDLRKAYQMGRHEVKVLNGVHYVMHPGELTFIIGRSGSGKSTLLHLIAGMDEPSSGKIVFEGENILGLKERALARIRNRRLGFVFQFYHLLPELTLFENVLLPSMIAGKKNKKWCEELLQRVGLWDRRKHYPSELSGGEQQRAAIARALINRPSLVLCDEPTGNLDPETAEQVFELIVDLNREEGQSFMIVTHDEALAWRYENVYRLVEGVLIPADKDHAGIEQVE